jgi:hypothetical protein
LAFGRVSAQLQGNDVPAPSPKPCQKPKILTAQRYIFSVNALMAEGQILFDTVSIGWVNDLGLFNATAAFSIFGAQQVTPTGATEQYLAGAGDLETFGY